MLKKAFLMSYVLYSFVCVLIKMENHLKHFMPLLVNMDINK